jgi:hypothetical protein
MARVNSQGHEIEAGVIEQLANGNYRMVAKGGGPRIEAGTVIEVAPSEIIRFEVGGASFLGPGAQQAAASPMPLAGPSAQGPEIQTITAADVGPMPMSIFSPSNEGAKSDNVSPAVPAPGSQAQAGVPRPAPSRTTMATTPPAPAGDHFKTLVSSLRADVQTAVAKAKALKARGPASLAAFGVAHKTLSDVYDEVDAATAEINGALQEPLSNGAPAPGHRNKKLMRELAGLGWEARGWRQRWVATR